MNWKYLAGFYDGEGTIGLNVVKEKRASRKKTETDGWYITPYIQISNTNLKILTKIQEFLEKERIISHIIPKNFKNLNCQRGYYLTIQSYPGLKKFLKKISFYSFKKEQIVLFNKFLRIKDNLPTLKRGTRIDNLKRNHWTKKLFLKAMKLRDELKNTKFRRNTKHKYNYKYFQKLWS